MKVLIVEDDQTVATYLSAALQTAGHNTCVKGDGKNALALALKAQFDLVIINMKLPEIDGLTVLEHIRKENKALPVLLLGSAPPSDENLLHLYSDTTDYLCQPVGSKDLLITIDQLLQRSASSARENTLRVGDLTLDLQQRKVTRGGTELALQAKEFQLLECLLRNRGQVVSRSMLLERVWNYHFDPQTNLIDVHISRLRQKVDRTFNIPLIETVRGTGYRIIDTPDQ
ncbi:response regulator transcription factor [Alteromonas sp. 14N.309.X.WAT.G.H12]|uniref:response regulator transcription factor n=1 Tax=Alteromonas sp. 14N.309.X.WAT.G.H12 TaxID=3120824 RepID=UPI002FD4916A